ncbi:hypothetical protein ABPG73_006117 [Tetrahymena malaccensis]
MQNQPQLQQDVENKLSQKSQYLNHFEKKQNNQQDSNSHNMNSNYVNHTLIKSQQYQKKEEFNEIKISQDSFKYNLNSRASQNFQAYNQSNIKYESFEAQKIEQQENSTSKKTDLNEIKNDQLNLENVTFNQNFNLFQQLSFILEQPSDRYENIKNYQIQYQDNFTQKTTDADKNYNICHNSKEIIQNDQNFINTQQNKTIKIKQLKNDQKTCQSEQIKHFLFDVQAQQTYQIRPDQKYQLQPYIISFFKQNKYYLGKYIAEGAFGVVFDGKMYVNNKIKEVIFKIQHSQDIFCFYEKLSNKSESEHQQFENFKKILADYVLKDENSERKTCLELHKLFYEAVVFEQNKEFLLNYADKIRIILSQNNHDTNKDIKFFNEVSIYYYEKLLELKIRCNIHERRS